MHRDAITPEVVARLVAEQFPHWAGPAVVPVAESGWDNRTFRLGDGLSVRLPTAEWYVAAVEKEHRWLPRLAPHLPLPIPVPVALGSPGAGYPWPWSVRRWIDGRPAAADRIADPVAFARDLASFLVALWHVEAAGPAAGAHSFHRGGALAVYDGETRAALAALGPEVDRSAVARVWDEALASPGTGRRSGSTATSRRATCWSIPPDGSRP
jgi:aminoglycoside phosphotransferase (APT) family kinase protein